MRLRLLYSGPLQATQWDRNSPRPDPKSAHKHAIRKEFHKQLKHFWETNWFLSTHSVFPSDYGASKSASNYEAVWGADPSEKVSLSVAVANNHCESGYRFVPLVRKDWRLGCSLEILFMRYDPPGSVVHAGDLDNRIKTLIDALTKPTGSNQLAGNNSPAEGEDPFYCLLEDDKLVTGLSVEIDQLLLPLAIKTDADRSQVHVVITAHIRPTHVTTFNLSFAS